MHMDDDKLTIESAGTMPLTDTHAGVAPRHGYLPPRYPVYRLTDEVSWRRLAPIPLLTDTFGDEVPPQRADIRLAWDETSLYLRAAISDDCVTCFPERAHDAPDFWQQDHVELRLLPDPARDMESCQFLLAVSGRYLAGGDASTPIDYRVERSLNGWMACAAIPFARLRMAPPDCGQIVRGTVGHVRWASGGFEPAMFSATQLGFGQTERYGEFHLLEKAPGMSMEAIEIPATRLAIGDQTVTVKLRNTGSRSRNGSLIVDNDEVWRGSSPVELEAGTMCRLSIDLPLQRPRFRHFAFRFVELDGSPIELGSITLRAAVPPLNIPPASLAHPYLHLDATGLEALRARAAEPWYSALADASRVPSLAPATEETTAFAFTRGCASWFRVARESMLRDGKGNRKAASARLWSLLPEDAQQAFAELSATVEGSPAIYDTLLAGMNSLLERPDLYDETAFARSHLPAATRAALAYERKIRLGL